MWYKGIILSVQDVSGVILFYILTLLYKYLFESICYVCMLIIMYVIIPNYWLWFFFFLLFIFLFHAVFVLGLWAMYAECLNKYMFCSVLLKVYNLNEIKNEKV